MNTEKPQAEYNCATQDLYTGVEMVWTSYADRLADFTAWKTTYDATTGTDQLAALDAARLIPDQDQRTAAHSSLNKDLGPLSVDCLIKWKQLEAYIRDGFPALIYQDMLNGAGYGYYEGASKENWEDVKGLMNDGEMFIASKTAELTAGGMPAGFDIDFTAAKDAFELKYAEFLQEEEHAREQRDEKINANNGLYHAAMAMCEDGKKIFRGVPAVREQFTWSRVQALIKSNRALHSVKGFATEADGGPVIVGALVRVLDTDGVPLEGKETVTADDGFYKIIGLKNGGYRLEVSADGYVAVVIPFTVDGAAVDLDVELVADSE